MLKKFCLKQGCSNTVESGYCEEHKESQNQTKKLRNKITDQKRGTAHERGYTAQWRRHRIYFLKRNALCVHCMEIGRFTGATVVDHIIDHKGNHTLFWDQSNWQSLCKSHHDIKTWLENSYRSIRHPLGLLPSAIPLTILCGPPGSGKTKYAQVHAAPNDIIIDLDAIRSDITGAPWYSENDSSILGATLQRRNRMLSNLSRESGKAAWFIVSAPRAEDRQFWKDNLKPSQVLIFTTPANECKRRIQLDERRADQANKFETLAIKWWNEYTRALDETVITLIEQERMYKR